MGCIIDVYYLFIIYLIGGVNIHNVTFPHDCIIFMNICTYRLDIDPHLQSLIGREIEVL